MFAHAHKCVLIMVIKVCLIGCGAIASVHLKAIQSLSDTAIQVVGLVDPIYESALSLKERLTHHGEECKVVYTSHTHLHPTKGCGSNYFHFFPFFFSLDIL